MMFRFQIRQLFSLIKKQTILKSSYDQLADIIARKYNNTEFKNSNTACLYEINHQFKIFKEGDCVLDVGAGPDYGWTDLTLKLIEHSQNKHFVVSNDIVEITKKRNYNTFVKGNFLDQAVQTNIALALKKRTIDTVLIDVSPQFTGNPFYDGQKIAEVVQDVFRFSEKFVKKGGNFVCKVIESDAQKDLQQIFDLIFNESYKYVPTIVRKKSPVCFLVGKGYMMNYHYHALMEFMKNYKGSAEEKIEVVKKYQNKYTWNPVEVIRKRAKEDVIDFKMKGMSIKEIKNIFESDPFVRIDEILVQLQKLDEAISSKDSMAKIKAARQYNGGRIYGEFEGLPTSKEQYITMVEEQIREIKGNLQKKGPEKPIINKEPLKDGEIYMKESMKVVDDSDSEKIYIEQDLEGKYEEKYEQVNMQREINKIEKAYPDLSEKIERVKKSVENNQDVNLEDVFDMSFDIEKQLADFKKMEDEKIDNEVDKEVGDQGSAYEEEFHRKYDPTDREQKADRLVNKVRGRKSKF